MFAQRGMDDLIYTHLSARLPGSNGRFLFIPFGMLFDEVTASNLLEVDVGGERCVRFGHRVNPAGWVVHRTVYDAVPAAQCVMHLHTICGTAVSAQKDGLLPVNQFGITYAGQIGYHDYDGPGLRPEEQKRFVANLGSKRMMFLRNHGTLTWGRSIAEAFTLMHYLERTCEIQVAAQGSGTLALPPQASSTQPSRRLRALATRASAGSDSRRWCVGSTARTRATATDVRCAEPATRPRLNGLGRDAGCEYSPYICSSVC